MCKHEISYSVDAGFNDILRVEFYSFAPGTKVYYAYGETFSQVKGGGVIDDEVENKLISLSFPNRLFLSIEHVTDPPGEVEFRFWYDDNLANDEAEEFDDDGFSLIT